MSNQEQLDAIFKRLSTEHGRLNADQQAFAIREIGRVRGELSDLLADFADTDGTVKKQRLNRLLRELDAVETSLRGYGTTAMDEILTETASWTTTRINNSVQGVIGVAAVSGGIERLNRDIVNYVARRFESDGLVLSDRVWRLSCDMRNELSKVLRANILRGESVDTMIRNIRKVHDNETWKIKRLVVTEGNAAYRTATSFNAKRSEVVTGLRLIACVKKSPPCVELADEDRHGLGKGIFLPDDSDIYSPHPNCTSYLTYELDERWL